MSKSRSVLAGILVFGLLVAAAPPASAASAPALAPVCRTASGLLGGATGLLGGLLAPLGLGRVQPDCQPSVAASAIAPVTGVVHNVAQTLPVTCWRAASPIAALGLSEVYVAAARACATTSIVASSSVWTTLYGACAQAGAALGPQAMTACFQAVGTLKGIHDRALGLVPAIA